MIIKSITLDNFRSHKKIAVELNSDTTTIMGENGCGKTSILEAIYEALQGKSFRAVDKEILRRGADFYRVELEYVDGRKVVVAYNGGRKEFLTEDRKTNRLPKKMRYPVTLFEPDDLHLVGASPTTKRLFFDKMFGQLSENYALNLSKYNKTLKQRNELLKTDNVSIEQLFSWDVMLAKYGTMLMEERRRIVDKINDEFSAVYQSIAENDDEVCLEYKTDTTDESNFIARLNRDFLYDSMLGRTSFGVHHDLYNFIFNNVNADGSASRGEVRSMVLALKFMEANMVTELTGKKPVVLLDDVFSELDETRQKCLVTNFKDNQVILTSVAGGALVIS